MSDTDNGLNPAPRAASSGVRRRRSRLPVYGFVLLFLVALVSLRTLGGQSSGTLQQLYRSVGIFTGNGSWAFEPNAGANAVFRVLAILAPLLTALGLTELATGAIGPLWVRLLASLHRRLRSTARPVALFGLDERSLGFAKTLADSGKFLPMIFAAEQDELLAERATSWRIPVIASPRPWWLGIWDDYQDLLGTRLRRDQDPIVPPPGVEDVVSFLPDAGAQVDLAARLVPRRDAAGRPAPLRVSLLMAERGLAQRLDDTLKFARSQQGVHPRLVDLDALAARLLLSLHPLDVLADAFGHRQIHLAIYGFGALGRAVAKEAARLCVTRVSLDDTPLRIIVLDRDADPLRTFLAEDPGIEAIADLHAIGGTTLAASGLTAQDVLGLIPEHVTAHVIALGDARAAFAIAVSLRRWLLEPPNNLPPGWQESHRATPIFIRMPDRNGIGRLVLSGVDRQARPSAEVPDGIFAFGTREALFAPDTLLDGARADAASKRMRSTSRACRATPDSDDHNVYAIAR